MSSGNPAVPGAGSPWIGRASAPPVPKVSRPVVRMIAFAGLALYGTVRWGTLLAPAPTPRLLGLVAIAFLLAALGPLLAARSRVLAVVFAIVAAVAMLAVCGLPLHWIRHLRVAVSSRAIGNGLSALPALLVPYRGIEPGVRMVILMGAAVLLFDAALMVAFALPAPWRSPGRAGTRGAETGEGGDLRRAVAALPLVALLAVPLTLVPARLPYLQGFFVFVLLATLVWGERLPASATLASVGLCGLAVAGAMVLAPALDAHRPWINYRSLAGDIGGNAAETFNWNQGYGPLNWPQNDRQVFEVKAAHGDYWKAENLDLFNGTGWSEESAAVEVPPGGVSPYAFAKWTQPVTVTLDAMTTTDIIGPGDLTFPTHSTEPVTAGVSDGRYLATTQLGPGDTYTVMAYSPHPTAAQLAAAGTDYPRTLLTQELAVTLPPSPVSRGYGGESTIFIPPYGGGYDVIQSDNGQSGTQLLAASPYEPMWALAQGLKKGTTTPYQFVENVKRFLQHGYTYNQNPPNSGLPLLAFLFQTKVGYCQQFAGAMALLLRLGGVPARVAVGFARGQYNAASHRWDVTDFDAHAWVEAFFPGYGWVEFDPTPASAPALKSASEPTLPAANPPKTKKSTALPTSHGLGSSRVTTVAGTSQRSGGSADVLIPLLIVLLVLTGAGVVITRPWHRPGLEDLVAELERAFARTGRPLTPQVTLSEIEHRLEGTPGAETYVRTLRRARYAQEAELPSARERRALRVALRSGLGITGALRALWAVPPRRPPVRHSARPGEHGPAGLH